VPLTSRCVAASDAGAGGSGQGLAFLAFQRLELVRGLAFLPSKPWPDKQLPIGLMAVFLTQGWGTAGGLRCQQRSPVRPKPCSTAGGASKRCRGAHCTCSCSQPCQPSLRNRTHLTWVLPSPFVHLFIRSNLQCSVIGYLHMKGVEGSLTMCSPSRVLKLQQI